MASPYEWIEREQDRLIEEWRDACRTPSVSGDGSSDMDAMARWARQRAESVLDSVEAHDNPGQGPVLIGTLRGSHARRLLMYSHYDVVPPGDGWTVPAFGGELRDGCVFARGVGDDKADVVARLHALECWKATRGEPPWSIVWLCEGAEEIGSPGLAAVLDANRELLQADGCLWESYYHSIDGRPAVGFGSCGALNVELTLTLLAADQHPGQAGVYHSPIERLVHALASFVDEHGDVIVEGFHDRVAETDEQLSTALANSPPPPRDAGLPGMNALRDTDLDQLTRRWLAEPSICMHGVATAAGALSDGVPSSARAPVSFRLMPDQDPDEIVELLRRHLDANGHTAVELQTLTAIPPARCAMDTHLAKAVLAAVRDVHGRAEIVRHPVVPGSGPLHLFARNLGVQAVIPPGTIRTTSHMHGPDEHARVNDYLDEVRLTVRILEHLLD
jgi:acetylornithine deacetylase/succinyl-diaminopimelate desuccinylase-like protein